MRRLISMLVVFLLFAGTAFSQSTVVSSAEYLIIAQASPSDSDGDGYNSDVDCDDNDSSIYPGNPNPIIGDGIDQNCDGYEECYQDLDRDSFGSSTIIASPDDICNPANGYASVTGDCDDSDPNNYPENVEVCDGQDNNCDDDNNPFTGSICEVTPSSPECVDEFFDTDGDGFTICGADGDPVTLNDNDCNDTNAAFYPGAFEICDDQDNDCDGNVDEGCDGGENVPPVANPNGPYLADVGSQVNFDGTGSSDPDDDGLTYDWDFGDNSSGVVVTPTHTYFAAGIYDVCLTVDDGEDSDEVCTLAVIYDPDGGFVTGGGWIDSPAGAYMPDSLLAGKAHFGFVSKYKKGADTPTGNTEFQFHAADLNFHSSSYDWLVVTGGDYAMFKGSGTVNGNVASNGSEYRFKLWAGDGDPDTFRIKIWWEDMDDEYVVYDNGMDQAIGGGSVVVHAK